MSTLKSAAKLKPSEKHKFKMKRFSEQLYKKSTSVKLQAAEKRELRERLVSYMEYHPLPAEMKTKKAPARENKNLAMNIKSSAVMCCCLLLRSKVSQRKLKSK